MTRLLSRIGRACAGHPWRVIAAWLLVAISLLLAGRAAGGAFVNEFRVPGADSQRAVDLARQHLPGFGTTDASVVLHRTAGPLTDPAARDAVSAMLARMRAQPDVTAVGDPLLPPEDPLAGGILSVDGRTAMTTVQYGRELGELTAQTTQRLDEAAALGRAAGIDVEFSGLVVDLGNEPATGAAELIGILAALVVLLFAFGSVVAAGLPIVVAIAGMLGGTALVLLVAARVDIPTAAPIVAVMLGLGAGIDYALFVLTTFRQRLAVAPLPVVDAVAHAVGSAGHAVVFAGGTVVVAILGLVLAGIPFISGMGIAAALTVTAMVLAAVTLLPAMLGLLGHRVNALRVGRGNRADREMGNGWRRWGRQVDRSRWILAAGALALLLVIAAPLLSLRLGTPDDGNMPSTWTQRRAYDIITREFGPGWNGPLLVVLSPTPDQRQGLPDRLRTQIAADPAVELVAPVVRSADGAVALLTVVPTKAPQSPDVSNLVHRLRGTILPAAGVEAHVGGTTAYMIDLADAVGNRLPWVIAAVVLAGSLLLLIMFRAPLIALKAAVMALISIAVAYGVLVAVFQWGWGLSLIGVEEPVPIMSIVPMLLFAVLFGLTMDYEVFLLSAIRDELDAGTGVHEAMIAGLARTGRVITAAALIMAVVFLSFVGIDDTLVKMVGIGLATAVVVDATVIRVVLGPALLAILGNGAWWPRKPVNTHPGPPAAPLEPTANE